MLGNAILVSFAFFVALAVVLLDRLKFLAPFKSLLFQTYGGYLGGFALLLFLNLFAGTFMLLRRFFLKNTGQKLLHLDKQVKTGHSVLSQEIAGKFKE